MSNKSHALGPCIYDSCLIHPLGCGAHERRPRTFCRPILVGEDDAYSGIYINDDDLKSMNDKSNTEMSQVVSLCDLKNCPPLNPHLPRDFGSGPPSASPPTPSLRLPPPQSEELAVDLTWTWTTAPFSRTCPGKRRQAKQPARRQNPKPRLPRAIPPLTVGPVGPPGDHENQLLPGRQGGRKPCSPAPGKRPLMILQLLLS